MSRTRTSTQGHSKKKTTDSFIFLLLFYFLFFLCVFKKKKIQTFFLNRILISAFSHPHFNIRIFPSAFYHPHFPIRIFPSAFLSSAFYHPRFVIRILLSAIRRPPSAIRHPPPSGRRILQRPVKTRDATCNSVTLYSTFLKSWGRGFVMSIIPTIREIFTNAPFKISFSTSLLSLYSNRMARTKCAFKIGIRARYFCIGLCFY